MQFKIDENLPAEAAELLTGAGYDAVTVLDQKLGGYPDGEISRVCQHEKRVVVTLDLGFSDIRLYPPQQYAGIIVFRLTKLNKTTILSALQRLLPVLGNEPLDGKL